MNSFDSFTLTPMSAGDIIDRAARLYRHNFLALLRVVLWPSLLDYTGTMLYTIGFRNFSMMRGNGRFALSLLLTIVGGCLFLAGKAAFYAVLGGASRSVVDHLFEGKPILARDVYRAVFKRFWSLIGALGVVVLLMAGAVVIIYFVVTIMILLGVFAVAAFKGVPYWLQIVLGVGYFMLIGLIALALGMLVYSRVVYVPQVMMVEGKGVFNSIGRSFSLAGKELWRITALLLFWLYVAWSVWSLLYVPLGAVAYWFGMDPNPFNQNNPFWFIIAYQTLTPLSEILITPVAMLGLTLLYLDSRVRKEGFDVELMANRLLPPTPQMVHTAPAPQTSAADGADGDFGHGFPSILGLNDYAPIRTASGALPATEEREFSEELVEPAIAEIGTFEVETPPIPLEAYTAAEQEDVTAESSAFVSPVETAARVCVWCGTKANGEDRFCRVCGSVF